LRKATLACFTRPTGNGRLLHMKHSNANVRFGQQSNRSSHDPVAETADYGLPLSMLMTYGIERSNATGICNRWYIPFFVPQSNVFCFTISVVNPPMIGMWRVRQSWKEGA
jgi:hypothetical protein